MTDGGMRDGDGLGPSELRDGSGREKTGLSDLGGNVGGLTIEGGLIVMSGLKVVLGVGLGGGKMVGVHVDRKVEYSPRSYADEDESDH
jgi:hypothetical protein